MSENANERFERLAAAFYAETSMMAPGKDVPAAMGGSDDYAERCERWDAWLRMPHVLSLRGDANVETPVEPE